MTAKGTSLLGSLVLEQRNFGRFDFGTFDFLLVQGTNHLERSQDYILLFRQQNYMIQL